MNFEDTSVVDFETEKIESRPVYPPKPVGVAIRSPGGAREYLAWGHPEGNNCDVGTARAKIKDAYQAKRVIFHHAAFDMDVAESHLGLPRPERFEDTLFLAFLKDPYAKDLGLKPLATKDLGMPPEEQSRLRDWIGMHVDDRKAKGPNWGEFIAQAPGGLVGKYAIGDVDRTHALYEAYYPEVKERGMMEAYERELQCVPITLEMERSGIRVDVKRLEKCRHVFIKMAADVNRKIAKKLGVRFEDLKSETNKKGFNINSGDQLGEALMRAGKLDNVIKTPTGKISTKIGNLETMCNDKALVHLLSVRSISEKYLSTFINPWLEMAAKTGGYITPKFNQTRGYDEGHGGARSGRYSSSDPNMQTVTANVEESKNRDALLYMQNLLKQDYGYAFMGLRDFFEPDEGMILCATDYDQQELRLLAHFERGILMHAYNENPKLDVHEFCRQLVYKSTGVEYERKAVKQIVFGLIYGMGVGKLALALDMKDKEARRLKLAILEEIPGINKLMKEFRRLSDHDEPLITWGGRQYFCEEPRENPKTGRMMDFIYKMLNYQIQPSAADVTKQGMIQVHERVPKARLALQVHDELVTMIPHSKYGKRVADAMCDMKFRVPMTATSKFSRESWARVKELKEAA